MGPQMATAAPMPNTYLSIMAAQSSNKPQPTTYAAIRYRRNAAMILGGTTGAAARVVGLLPASEAERSVISPAGSTGTSAVLLGQGCQRLVVCGQFRVVVIIFADHRDGDGHCLVGALHAAVPTVLARFLGIVGRLGSLVRRGEFAVSARAFPTR